MNEAGFRHRQAGRGVGEIAEVVRPADVRVEANVERAPVGRQPRDGGRRAGGARGREVADVERAHRVADEDLVERGARRRVPRERLAGAGERAARHGGGERGGNGRGRRGARRRVGVVAEVPDARDRRVEANVDRAAIRGQAADGERRARGARSREIADVERANGVADEHLVEGCAGCRIPREGLARSGERAAVGRTRDRGGNRRRRRSGVIGVVARVPRAADRGIEAHIERAAVGGQAVDRERRAGGARGREVADVEGAHGIADAPGRARRWARRSTRRSGSSP